MEMHRDTPASFSLELEFQVYATILGCFVHHSWQCQRQGGGGNISLNTTWQIGIV